MEIILTDIGKRFNREWIFRHLSLHLASGDSLAIIGSNGSGKSTLLQVIAGYATFNEGTICCKIDHAMVAPDHLFRHISLAAPYLELVEEMTASELLQFHHCLKPLFRPVQEVLKAVALESSGNKQIRYFSSGMKQRLKLAQAFFTQSALLLLDEPTTNLDQEGIQIYETLLKDHLQQRTLIIASNDVNEYRSCMKTLVIEEYKMPQPTGKK